MSLTYAQETTPAPGEPREVAPGIFWLRMPLPFQLDHINLWLLRDGAGWVIVDTGFANDESRAAWTQVLAGLDGPVTGIVATHFHPDHLGLATWLIERTGAPLYMSAGEFLTAHAVWHELGGHGAPFMTEQFRQHGLSGERLEKFAVRGPGYRKSMPALPDAYRRLMAGETLQIDGKAWRIVVGHGHSPEHVALYCAEQDVFISGDMLLPRISTNISVFASTPDADSLGWFIASLQAMARELPEETLVLPSHGLPFHGIQDRVEALCRHHEDRCRELEEGCGHRPATAADMLGVLFPRELDMHQTMFAMGEAIAHLNHLEKAGRLSRSIDAQGVIRFTRPS